MEGSLRIDNDEKRERERWKMDDNGDHSCGHFLCQDQWNEWTLEDTVMMMMTVTSVLG